MKTLLACALLALPAAAAAQDVSPCDGRISPGVIAEPWEANTRTFANGAVRVALLNTEEPVMGPFQLLVLTPPAFEGPWRQCRVVSFDGGIGFYDLDFESLDARYDPSTGLVLHMVVQIAFGEQNFGVRGLEVTINQALGTLVAELKG
ncbi:MAG: hypothetical protein CSA74_10800 [Rhodobacterales bacterium]|nr:MAG: hypothetical protein CSA74_10800 [Rhodobacterales bacterium]